MNTDRGLGKEEDSLQAIPLQDGTILNTETTVVTLEENMKTGGGALQGIGKTTIAKITTKEDTNVVLNVVPMSTGQKSVCWNFVQHIKQYDLCFTSHYCMPLGFELHASCHKTIHSL